MSTRHAAPRPRKLRSAKHESRQGGVLSMGEIKSRYPSQWILIQDPVVGKDLRITKGRVAHHSPDRDEVYRKAIELRLASSATVYTGRLPANTATLL